MQELQQNETRDGRMVRAIALRKAIRWRTESRRRALFDELLANIDESGEFADDYRLPSEHRETLKVLIEERREHPSASYEQNKITAVLQWLAEGRPTPARGPEKRRIKALKTKYGKKVFFGAEKRALERIIEQWKTADDPGRSGAALKFAVMLEGRHAELDPEEEELCTERAAQWEELYQTGRLRLAGVVQELAGLIVQKDTSLDHPPLYDLVRFLGDHSDVMRQRMAQSVLLLRQRKYVVIYLSQFLLMDSVNPVMAVETPRLTKDEHEELLAQELTRRRLACLDVLLELGLQYCREPFTFQGIDPDPSKQEKFFRDEVLGTFEVLLKDKQLGSRAEKALDELRKVCAKQSE